MKTKIIYFVLFMACIPSYAQQDAQYTQYMYNTTTFNPAYVGSKDVLSIFGLYRTQWVGLDGAPKTGAFSVSSPINNKNFSVGFTFINDRIGPMDENTFSVDVAYTIPTSENYKLSFGIKGKANLFNLDVTKTTSYSATDVTYQNIKNDMSPNIGTGVYFFSNKLYLGASVPNILQTIRYNDNTLAVYKERMNLYFMGGYVFDLTPSVKFKPAFLTKVVEGAPLQVDVSGNFMFNEKFVLGVAWRWDASFSAMAGFQVNQGLYIGYGYDRESTNLIHYNSGSHEVFLRYELFKKQDKIISPRFF